MPKSISEVSSLGGATSDSSKKSTRSRSKVKKTEVIPEPQKPNFLYQPHYITGLVFLLGYLTYLAFIKNGPEQNSIFKGLTAVGLSFIYVGSLMFKSGPFIRPHPLFWRFILSCSVLYLLAVIFLLFQDVNDARNLMGQIDVSLGKPLAEKSYAEDCSLTYDNLKVQMDFFIIAHVFGWFAKTILLRDVWICWILSVMFEFCEYSLQHQLPNFAECWWDHWLLDVLICNWLGIWMGMKVIQWLRMKPYNWRSIRDIPSVGGMVKRSVAQFTPYSWTDFNWAATKSLKGYVVVVILCTLLLTSEVIGFYMKYLLWIPPPHYLYVGRSVLYAFAGCAGIRELYQFCVDPECKSIGAQAWILMATIITEVLVVFKWSEGVFTEPFPKTVIVFWSVFSVFLVLFPIWKFYLHPKSHEKHKIQKSKSE